MNYVLHSITDRILHQTSHVNALPVEAVSRANAINLFAYFYSFYKGHRLLLMYLTQKKGLDMESMHT